MSTPKIQLLGSFVGEVDDALVKEHNLSSEAHSDIRQILSDISERLNAFLDSDDTTLDELSELVEYIKSNKTLIEGITTSKVSVTDIVDNLTTNLTDKPLSAVQGTVLKRLIDDLSTNKLDANTLANAIETALADAKASGMFDGADGKSAYEYAQEGGYAGTEEEFSEKLAKEIPSALPNPNKINFTGAVEGSYDGSEELTVNIPETTTIDQVDPSKVIFPEGLQTTYEFGKIKLENGSATLVQPGGTLSDFFNTLVDETNPTTTDPSVSLTFSQAKAYEVGTKVTPSYSASLNPGSYTYGPPTGVTATKWEISDTDGNKAETASGSFPELQVKDGISYKITAKATYGDGAIPVTNVGNEYAAGQIKSSTASTTSGAITGYRNTFYGTLTEKSDITSGIVRGLTGKSGKSLANGNSFTVTVPVGALRVVIAYPATLRNVTSIKDVNGLNAEISSGFTASTLDVTGANSYTAISYKVYTMDFASANDKANKFTVTI